MEKQAEGRGEEKGEEDETRGPNKIRMWRPPHRKTGGPEC